MYQLDTTAIYSGDERTRPVQKENFPWLDEHVAVLERLWREGESCSRIAKALGGGLSRNAVIGKVHRLGLSGRATTSRMKTTRPRRHPKRPAPRPAGTPFAEFLRRQPQEPTPVVQAADDTARVTFAQLDADRPHQHCRWPVGDPRLPGFGFCGCQPVPGLPYCEQHARRAYAPPTFQKAARANGSFKFIPRLGMIKSDAAALAAIEEFVA